MKVFVAIAVTLALFATSMADEDFRTMVLNFYECISCSKDQAARDEFMKCTELRSENHKKIVEECKATLSDDQSTLDENWSALCKNEDGIREKWTDCILKYEERKDTSEEEENQMTEFMECAKKVGEKFCENH